VGYKLGDEKKLEEEIVHLLALINAAADSTIANPVPVIEKPVIKSSK
jgi:hypothetical protein